MFSVYVSYFSRSGKEFWVGTQTKDLNNFLDEMIMELNKPENTLIVKGSDFMPKADCYKILVNTHEITHVNTIEMEQQDNGTYKIMKMFRKEVPNE